MTKIDRQRLIDATINEIFDKNEQLRDFVVFLKENNFFCNMSALDIEELMNDEIVKLSRGDITVWIDRRTNQVGIDPTQCFDSIKRASIIIDFPMKKRPYARTIKELAQVFDKNNRKYKEWMEYAPICFYGDWEIVRANHLSH